MPQAIRAVYPIAVTAASLLIVLDLYWSIKSAAAVRRYVTKFTAAAEPA